jgi:hypothetical protein
MKGSYWFSDPKEYSKEEYNKVDIPYNNNEKGDLKRNLVKNRNFMEEKVRKDLRVHEPVVAEDSNIMEEDQIVSLMNAEVVKDFDTEILNWKNERNEYVMKTVPRIMSKHHKKLRCGLKLVIRRICQIFHGINSLGLKGKAKEVKLFIQEAYR